MNKAMRNDLKDVRVALMTSPTVFQYLGGLNIQIRETLAALQKLGLQAELVDPVAVDLSTYDVIHAFSAINGCQRIIQHAKAIGKVAIGSPLIRPHWTRSLGRQARFLDRVVGKLTGWNVQTEYRHIASFLHESDQRAHRDHRADHDRGLGVVAQVGQAGEHRQQDVERVPVAVPQVLPAGQVGEIYVRGDQVSGQYRERSALDADGWFPTRDAGYLDAEGYLFLAGRADDVIVRGGENISPGEIEDLLLTHPAIADCAAVAVPSLEWGEAVGLAVVVRGGCEQPAAQELQNMIRARLRSSRVPEVVRFVASLPYNEMGKLLRREVKSLLA